MAEHITLNVVPYGRPQAQDSDVMYFKTTKMGYNNTKMTKYEIKRCVIFLE